jgi:hypothetical protein
MDMNYNKTSKNEYKGCISKNTNISAREIKEALIKESKFTWRKFDFIDWFLDKFPVCSNYTVKELINIAGEIGIKIK